MTHQPEPSTDTPALLSALVISATLLVAGQAAARDIMPAPAPEVLSVELDTDSLYWDLCVGSDNDDAINTLAEQIASDIDDPDSLYVIQLPQLGKSWATPGRGTLKSLDGAPINRRRLAMYRSGYEARVERALLQVVSKVQEQRPGARVSIQDFHTTPLRNSRRDAYTRLEDKLSFVSLSDSVDMKSSRKFDRWLDGKNIDDDSTVLVQTDDGWVLAGDDSLLEQITEPLNQAYVTAWPDETVLGDTALPSENTFESGAKGGDDGGPSNRVAMNPDDYIGGGGAIAQGRRTLSNIEIIEHEEYQGKVAANRPEPPSDPEPDDPNENPGGPDNPDPDDPVEPQSGSVPLLIPGTGFTGPTAVPNVSTNISIPGHDATAIARWDVVPYQTIDGSFEIGVVAFHYGDIQRVDFSLNDGPWQSVYEMTLNPRTEIEEYTARVDTATLPDGQFEVRAIVYPENGEPRVLGGTIDDDALFSGEHSLFMYAMDNASMTRPVLEIGPEDDLAAALETHPEGGVIHLRAGDYDIREMRTVRNMSQWLTVRPAPGLSREDVRIRPPLGEDRAYMKIKGQLIRWQDLTFDLARIKRLVPHPGDSQWFDGCLWIDSNGWDHTYSSNIPTPFGGTGTWYSTDSTYYSTRFGPMRHQMVRKATIEMVSGEVFEGTRAVFGATLDNVDGSILENAVHTDVVQWHDNTRRHLENLIVYDVTGVNLFTQQFFLRTGGGAVYEDIAFVDVMFKTKTAMHPTSGRPLRDHTRSQLWCDQKHVLFKNVSSDISLNLRTADSIGNPDEGFVPHNVKFINCQLTEKTIRNLNEAPAGLVHENTSEWTWWED